LEAKAEANTNGATTVGGALSSNLRKRMRESEKAAALLAEAEAGRAKKPRAKETVRQKNKRKQKLGQAKFTVKSERECPDIYRPP